MSDTAYSRFALSLPGLWIRHSDRDLAGHLLLLLGFAAEHFNDALIAFDLFNPFAAGNIRRATDGTPQAEGAVDSRRRFLYARAFVYALDTARGFVQVVAEEEDLSSATVAACEAFLGRFGYIREIRNSLQHIEERTRAKGARGKRLSAPVLELGSLIGRRFGITTGRGEHREIEISEQFIERFRSALSEVFWSLEWLGPGETFVQRKRGE